MSEAHYLIAHKVRGEAAFDIAIRMECPICRGTGAKCVVEGPECGECIALGYWWIIPTSGHRAYPWWHQRLDITTYTGALKGSLDVGVKDCLVEPMPPDWPDHYQCDIDAETLRAITVTDIAKAHTLLEQLGLMKKPEPFTRRV